MNARLLRLAAVAPLLGACSDQKLTALQPIASLSPEEVVFRDLMLGEPAVLDARVGNAGRADLHVEAVTVSAPFSVSWEGDTLPSGHTRAFEITFTPTTTADYAMPLVVVSDDPVNPVLEATVRASPRAPDIAVSPSALRWSDAGLGGLLPVTVTNEGEGPLRITGLAVAADGGGVFQLGTSGLPSVLGPGEVAEVDVVARPSELAEGLLRVLSSDPDEPVVDVPLSIGALVQSCPEGESWPPEAVDPDDTCAFAGLPPAWDPVVEASWRAFSTFPTYDESYQPPGVGRVTDDNGDGVIDEHDPPDLCLQMNRPWEPGHRVGVLRLLSSDGRTEHWTRAGWTDGPRHWQPTRSTSCTLADVDADGVPELFTGVEDEHTGDYGLVALDADGSLRWSVAVDWSELLYFYPSAAVADLEGDGLAELVLGNRIYDAETGVLLAAGEGLAGIRTGYAPWPDGPRSFPMDLDNDGVMEIVGGSAIYEADGSQRCEADTDDGIPAAADLDNDGDGEVVLANNHQLVVFEHDCTVRTSWPLDDGGMGGAPTLADFDGDGLVEIGIASKYAYFVFESDGTVLWQSPIRDESSHRTGSSVFDFDGDGASEVVFADEYDLYVMDGATGRPRFLWTGHASGTGAEYPVIADVDDDGSAEIVVVHGRTTDDVPGVSIVGSASSGWMPARPVWNQYAWSHAHVTDTLAVPADPAPNWPALNSFRSADTLGETTDFDRNARPALVDVCNLDCDEGQQVVVVRVDNPGAAELPWGIEVALVSTISGEEVVVAEQVVEDAIPAGSSSWGLRFSVDTALLPDRTLSVVVDPDNRVDECDETDNRLDVTTALCPAD